MGIIQNRKRYINGWLKVILLALVLFVVMTYAAAWFLYQVVEKPLLRVKERYLS